MFLLLGMILVVLVSGCTSISTFQTLTAQDPVITACTQSFNDYKETTSKKYGYSLSLIEMERFDNFSEANEFYDTWRDPMQLELTTYLRTFGKIDAKSKDSYPLVLFASKLEISNGVNVVQVPIVIVCDKNGKLIQG